MGSRRPPRAQGVALGLQAHHTKVALIDLFTEPRDLGAGVDQIQAHLLDQ
ncbi:MAG TPA: hypothetical protein VI793_08495 [Anaerolineales bacterium]|nr:hypothetical protein [Anaerolineales bacterium]